MLIVTGGTGFIGCNLVRLLNRLGSADIMIVDDVDPALRPGNLRGCKFADYVNKESFFAGISQGRYDSLAVDGILHQGACANTMELNERELFHTNFTYSKVLLDWVIKRRIPFIYASSAAVYGSSGHFAEEPTNEVPLNAYAKSKAMFDCYVRDILKAATSTVVGLRYFNVYGRNEKHKGPMASMVHQLHQQLLTNGVARLFGAFDGFGPGEQRRDFVFVEDIVKANVFFLNSTVKRGIYNVATGQSRTFNEVAKVLISLCGSGRVEYVPFPPNLSGKYQSFTQADLARLRSAGFDHEFASLEEGIRRAFFIDDQL